MDFLKFKQAVSEQFAKMAKYPLYRVAVSSEQMWQRYLESFPAGTNPIYRQRTEHDCSCCRHFIRDVGNVVAFTPEGELMTLWDVELPCIRGYKDVASGMRRLMLAHPIDNIYLHYEKTAGTDKSFEQVVGDAPIRWDHFHVTLPTTVVVPKAQLDTRLGAARSAHSVFDRALREITLESVDSVLELIAQGSLYRGEEHLNTLRTFRNLKAAYLEAPSKSHVAWRLMIGTHPAITGIRNTSIGTLLVDLSEGKDLEASVQSFEAKVAPTNYKRPTALVTPTMVAKAKVTLHELGLLTALDRRYAVARDLSVNDILFAARKAPSDDVFDGLATKPQELGRVEEVPIDKFISDILPRISTMEVLLENRLAPNLMSLVTAQDPMCRPLMKWKNNFSWSYNGEVADSIQERVKAAGGSVTGDLCCRLAWFNHDDLDLHMFEPSGYHIYFGNRSARSPSGGLLDVDMNAGFGTTRTPVENIFYSTRRGMVHGIYSLKVNNFARRESRDPGFEVEIDIMGEVTSFSHPKPLPDRQVVEVAQIQVDRSGIRIVQSMPSRPVTKELWNLTTGQFHHVNLMTLSPNFWGEHGVGNKHYFFMLDACRSPKPARGFYNEFLAPELDVHRKVLEMVGSKMTVPDSPDQLSGLGFSSTKRDTLTCRVKGSFTRTIKIVF